MKKLLAAYGILIYLFISFFMLMIRADNGDCRHIYADYIFPISALWCPVDQHVSCIKVEDPLNRSK